MLGLSGFYPKFVKKYASLNRIIEKAVKNDTTDVRLKKFPTTKNFYMEEDLNKNIEFKEEYQYLSTKIKQS